jgi:hypothetical protein
VEGASPRVGPTKSIAQALLVYFKKEKRIHDLTRGNKFKKLRLSIPKNLNAEG